MLGDLRTRRWVWVATGVAWALSSLLPLAQAFVTPLLDLRPVTALVYSLAWLLFGWSSVLVSRLAAARRTHIAGLAVAAAAGITAIANILVNVAGVAGIAEWYSYGILIATVLLVPFAYLFARERLLRLTAFTLGTFLGIGFAPPVLGGLVVLALFLALALRTAWFESRDEPGAPPATEAPTLSRRTRAG
jgi:hypothetical protein